MTAAAVSLKMQILCWISIGLISHGSSLNVNRPSSRWARSDDNSDGWKASNGPFNPEPYPVIRPAITSVAPSVSLAASTAHAHPARKEEELVSSSLPLPLLTALSPEGFYELVVGKKSPLSGGESAIGGGEGGSGAPTGSPDVIIGRVMSATAGIESAPTSTTTAASVIGYSHPHPPQPVISEQTKEKGADGEPSEIRESFEKESRSPALLPAQQEPLIIRKNDYPTLPPGSFYIPAVSTKANQYYSDSEHSIYIPLRRQDPFPVRTRVVLVNNQQPPAPAPPPAAVYHSKEAVEEEENEEEEEEEEPKSAEEEEEEDNEEELDAVAGASHHRPTEEPPGIRSNSPMDLVMTLYPNLPKLMSSSSHFTTHAIKNFLKLNKAPATGGSSTSVIHEAKFVTPPQGYLPQLVSKPPVQQQQQQPFVSKPVKPNVVKPGSTQLTQLRASPSKPVNSFAAYPSDQRHHPPTASTTTVGGTRTTTIQFTPFTPDDISPLNFLLPPASSSSSSSSNVEKVTAADQPDTRSATKYGASPNGDLIADSNVQITQSPLKVVPAPKLDFSWNLFQPLPSEVSHQQTAGGDLPLFTSFHASQGSNNHQQQQQQQQQQKQQPHPQPEQKKQTKPASESSGHQHLVVPGETGIGEIVVRTKMATSGSDSGKDVNRPGIADSVDIITSYYHDAADKNKYPPIQQPHLLPKQTENRLDKEVLTTTTPVPPTSPAAEEVVVATTTLPSRDGTAQPVVASHQGSSAAGDKFPHRYEPQDHSHQPDLVSDVPLAVLPQPSTTAIRVDKPEDDVVYLPPRLSDIADDQHVAGSQIHETTVYEENLPRIRPIKPQSLDLEGEGKASTPFYKAGKMSPKGAMYTVTQGHSKVKFFGFNALHNGELKPIDGKYLTYLQQHQEQQQQQQQQHEEFDWKFSPYLPVRLPASGNPAFKFVPKKSIPISPGKKSTIRPVFFNKRHNSNNRQGPSNAAPWSPSIALSEPFEYHAHLEKMAEDQGRLPSQSSPSA